MTSPMVRFRVLGPVEMRVAGRPVPLGGPRQRAVLGALLLHANVEVSTRTLLRLVWTDTPRSARSNLRTYLTRLRRVLHVPGEPASRLHTGADGHAVTVRPGELDLADFTVHAAAGERAAHAGAASAHLTLALAAWRGPAFADLAAGLPLDAEVIRLEARREHVRERLLQTRLALGEHAELVPELRALLAHDPLAEDKAALLMLALHRCGKRAEALEVYRSTRAALVGTIGLEPGPELRDLHVHLLADDRMSAATLVVPPARLPADPEPFAGRADELAELTASWAALHEDQRRMLDLLGLHLGTDVQPRAAAALAGVSVPMADRLLDDLVDARLLRQTAPGHYRLHPLVRAYVRGRARGLDRPSMRRALHRLLDYHLAQTG